MIYAGLWDRLTTKSPDQRGHRGHSETKAQSGKQPRVPTRALSQVHTPSYTLFIKAQGVKRRYSSVHREHWVCSALQFVPDLIWKLLPSHSAAAHTAACRD